MAIGNVALGMSVNKVKNPVYVTRAFIRLSYLTIVWQGILGMYVRSTTEINMQEY